MVILIIVNPLCRPFNVFKTVAYNNFGHSYAILLNDYKISNFERLSYMLWIQYHLIQNQFWFFSRVVFPCLMSSMDLSISFYPINTVMKSRRSWSNSSLKSNDSSYSLQKIRYDPSGFRNSAKKPSIKSHCFFFSSCSGSSSWTEGA